jgi:hypothetical protein
MLFLNLTPFVTREFFTSRQGITRREDVSGAAAGSPAKSHGPPAIHSLKSSSPARPDFSGWNWHARTPPFFATLVNSQPA